MERKILFAQAILLLTGWLYLARVFGHEGDEGFLHHQMMGAGYGWWGLVGFNSILITIVLILLIIFLVVIIRKHLHKQTRK